MEERQEQYKIEAWCLQEWRSYRNAITLEWVEDQFHYGERLYAGYNTAIVVVNREWQIIGETRHAERASRITVQIPGNSKPWTILNVYLPATVQGRKQFFEVPSFARDLLLDDLDAEALQQTIVLGDFNEIQSVYRHLYPD
ncbi:hypothetical protein [Sporisorium scitamineum]|uniref:Endonuclease/exonuclease/phosphatase domain-containing protein n=1 Tax=Sporisorium scitamineum TaxID=49012 RepID=A0A0F7SBS4_9BASI|nr:hypothetical protein [Sporisorium scitamineum]